MFFRVVFVKKRNEPILRLIVEGGYMLFRMDKKERIRNQKIDTERESYYVFSCRKL